MAVPSDRVEAVFNEAIEISDPQARVAYLDKACRGEGELRARVEALLNAHTAAADFLPLPRGEETVDAPSPAFERPGTMIGRYKLLQQIGEGGFGTVFMAEQEEPVRRRVALKIIKLGMDTRQVVARFEAERQALAMMDHAGIARVFDAGATGAGRPYFVMELVKGVPITEYCDKNNLSVSERLELFIPVCLAVQHAHQKGLIHRDIKPSNVLVSTQDDRPIAKVIDFGIAKATQSHLTEKTLFTEFRQLIGTPEYMSPEQAEGNLDIDTRSDVYSLGVLLYELLTGTTPHDARELRSKAFAEMQRIIREVDPPKPSTRLSTMKETLPSVAAKRAIEPRKLNALVQGELDWIVMKALEKNRGRRYESPSSLAADLMHHMANEPVTAGAPSGLYRLKKFVRRHRGAVVACAAVFVVLVAGVIGTTVAMLGQKTLRGIAENEKGIAQHERGEAQKQAAIAEAVTRFQTEMFASVDPDKLLGDKVTVVDVMMTAVRELDLGKLEKQPLVEAGVRDIIGNTLRSLGRYQEAESNLRRGLELRRAKLPSNHLAIGWSLQSMGMISHEMAREAEAEQYYRQALAIYRQTSPVPHHDIRSVLCLLTQTLINEQGKRGEAEAMARESVDDARQFLPPGDPEVASCINAVARVLHEEGKLKEAEVEYRKALEIRQKSLAAAHPDVAMSLNNLAEVLRDQRRYDEAEGFYRQSLDLVTKAMPAGHIYIGASMNNLGLLLQAKGELGKAESYLTGALEIFQKQLPADHPNIAMALNNLGLALRGERKPVLAEKRFREAIEIMRKSPTENPNIFNPIYALARLQLEEKKDYVEAEKTFRDALAVLNRADIKDDMRVGMSRIGLGQTLISQLQFAKGEPELLEAERLLAGLGAKREYDQCAFCLVVLYNAWDKVEPLGGYRAKAEHWKTLRATGGPASAPATRMSPATAK